MTPAAPGAASGTRAPVPVPVTPDPLAQFVSLSATLTGFDAAALHGTGMVQSYLTTLTSVVGESHTARLLGTWARVSAQAGGDPGMLDQLVTSLILGDPALGPLARNLIVLWYMGEWTQLPADWRNTYGANAKDETFIVSTEAYIQGLVWDAIHAHPQGAKQPGYGSWALPPQGSAS